MIRLDNASYSYTNGSGISNINLTIGDDEFAFIIGPTGSGKPPLLRMVYMDLLPQVGKVVVDEFDSKIIKSRKIPFLRRKIGMIFQDYHLLDDRNLFDNIALALHVLGCAKDEIVDRVTESLEEVGLDGKDDRYPEELSGGEQQRACIARALVKDPDIILADEPTGNLDPVTSFELIKLLEEVNREGTAIIMASHDYNLIKGRGHRIIEIQDGSVRQS